MLCLMNRCRVSFTDVVAHLQMKWLNGDVVVAHLDFFSSFGEVVAHLKMKWLNLRCSGSLGDVHCALYTVE